MLPVPCAFFQSRLRRCLLAIDCLNRYFRFAHFSVTLPYIRPPVRSASHPYFKPDSIDYFWTTPALPLRTIQPSGIYICCPTRQGQKISLATFTSCCFASVATIISLTDEKKHPSSAVGISAACCFATPCSDSSPGNILSI